jgi:hypothetical protein
MSITALQDYDGVTHCSQPELEGICHQFYSNLYAARPSSEDTHDAQTWAFSGQPKRLPLDLQRRLAKEITLEELTAALKGMANSKSPGPDGIITELYKCLWHVMGPDYFSMLQDSITRGSLPPGVTEGLIALLHKGGCRASLNN